MKRDVLNRYERDADGSVVIDVATGRAEDLYNDFDRSAPYTRRDLDQDLVDYLIDCAKEIGREPFVIRFTLAEPPQNDRLVRVRRSIDAYFVYLAAMKRRTLRQMVRRCLLLLGIGLVVLFFALWLHRSLGPDRTILTNVIAEGITIAAWVSVWEGLATFVLGWFPHRREIRLYERLAQAKLLFRPESSGEQSGSPLATVESPALDG